MKKILCLIIALILPIATLSACFTNDNNVEFDTLDDRDDELYRDATTFKFNIIKFGKQNDQDLTWYVVESYTDYRVLLSEKILDLIPYNDTDFDVNYEDSSLYRYIENDFVSQYFSKDEQKKLLSYKDGTKATIPTLDNLREYFGEVNLAKSGYYGNEEYFKANKEMIAKPAESSANESLVNNVFDNLTFAKRNEV